MASRAHPPNTRNDAWPSSTTSRRTTSSSNSSASSSTPQNVPPTNHRRALSMRVGVNAILSQRAVSAHPEFAHYSLGRRKQRGAPRGVRLAAFRPVWDVYMLILLAYVATASVFVYSFLGVLTVSSSWFWMERFLDLSFVLDVVFSFFFPPYERSGEVVHSNRRDIAVKYRNTWLLWDLLAAFPWDILVLALVPTSQRNSAHWLQLPRFLKLVKFLKLSRLFRVFRLQEGFNNLEVKFRLKYGHVRLVALYTTVILITHWFACVFYYFGSLRLDNSWLSTPDVPSDLFGRYITALYFSVYTVTTIGYGDVTPENTTERTYTTIIMFLGAGCFAYIISQVSNISGELNKSSSRLREKIDALTDLQKARELPDFLVKQIRQYFNRASRKLELNTELELLKSMTREHRMLVLKHIYGERLKKSKLFEKVPLAALDIVYEQVREKAFMSGQLLYKRGDAAKSFFILIKGCVQLREHGDKDPVTIAERGELFGDSDILFNQTRQGEAVCTDFTTVICVPRKAVMEVLAAHPEQLKKLRDTEALILWQKAITNVEQQIGYMRFARTMRTKAEDSLRGKGLQVEMSSRDTSTQAMLQELRSGRAARTQTDTHASHLEHAGENDNIRKLRQELEKKKNYIHRLEKQLKKLQTHCSLMMNVLGAHGGGSSEGGGGCVAGSNSSGGGCGGSSGDASKHEDEQKGEQEVEKTNER